MAHYIKLFITLVLALVVANWVQEKLAKRAVA